MTNKPIHEMPADWMYHDMKCASRRIGPERGSCDCGVTATIAPTNLGALRTAIGTVLRQVEITSHRADALPPGDYSNKPTVAEWRERVTWLVDVLKKTRDAMESERLAHLRAAAVAAGACINCRHAFEPTEIHCWYGSHELGPLCEACDRIVKVHTRFREAEGLT